MGGPGGRRGPKDGTMSYHDCGPLRLASVPFEAGGNERIIAACRCAAERRPGAAGPLSGEFHRFVRTLASTAKRPLQWRPSAGLALSFDEARVLQMIEAAQCGDRCRLEEVAAKLLAAEKLADCLRATQSLANALAARDCFATDR
jgi:hypothetical protein